MSFAAVIGGGLALTGAVVSGKAAKKAAKTAAKTSAEAAKQATTTLGGSQITGAGGSMSTLRPDGTGGQYDVGDLENARRGLNQFGTNTLGQIPNQLPPQFQQLLQQIMQQGTQMQGNGNGALDFMAPAVQQQFSGANEALSYAQQNPFQQQLQNNAFKGAGDQLAIAGQNPSAVRDQQLALMRQQAQPQEDRAWQQLQQDQFGSGRMGTTGGGIQTEAFAKGLGEADLSRQLAAQQAGQSYQQNALGLGQGLAGVGGNTASLGSQLLQQAFGNFGNTLGLGANLSGQQFNQNATAQSNNLNNLNNVFGANTNFQQLLPALQGNQLNLGLQALQGQQGIQQGGLQQLQAALSAAQAGANARLGAGQNAAQFAQINQNQQTGGDVWGNALTGIGSRVAGNSGGLDFGSIIGKIFGKGQTPGFNPNLSGQSFLNPAAWGAQP